MRQLRWHKFSVQVLARKAKPLTGFRPFHGPVVVQKSDLKWARAFERAPSQALVLTLLALQYNAIILVMSHATVALVDGWRLAWGQDLRVMLRVSPTSSKCERARRPTLCPFRGSPEASAVGSMIPMKPPAPNAGSLPRQPRHWRSPMPSSVPRRFTLGRCLSHRCHVARDLQLENIAALLLLMIHEIAPQRVTWQLPPPLPITVR